MAKHNTHRAAGRAVSPVAPLRRAAHGFGGAAVLGTVLAGAAIADGTQSASAADIPAAPVSHVAAAATKPAAPVATAKLDSTEKLRRGSRGDAVRDLQRALNDNGAGLAVDGKFGPRTNDAVQSFQSDSGLEVDGVVGPLTRGALNGGADVAGSGRGAAAPTSSTGGSGQSIVEAARNQVGVHYTWGGSSRSTGFDCSGLVSYALGRAGIDTPHSSSAIANAGTSISRSELRPGDVVVYPGHVGIYSGNGRIIDASGSQQRVVERDIWGSPSGYVTFR